ILSISPPPLSLWKAPSLVGVLVLACGNGSVVWAQQFIPSGIAAMLIATTPFWMILFDRFLGGGRRLNFKSVFAMCVGFLGVMVLLYHKGLHDLLEVPLLPAIVNLLAACWWSLGSMLSRYLKMPQSPWWNTAIQMFAGGVMLIFVGSLQGEWGQIQFKNFSMISVFAWVYLVLFGSILTYSAYLYMLRHSSPTRVSTYAFVNPLVALSLGWLFLGEVVNSRIIIAASMILISVMILISEKEKLDDSPK
ncbi:MAG: EamA family transporter, partial [Deltaproteobacteria bacterium]|nr:EamA family transporter [Deltaproteobacteria bacterium]